MKRLEKEEVREILLEDHEGDLYTLQRGGAVVTLRFNDRVEIRFLAEDGNTLADAIEEISR